MSKIAIVYHSIYGHTKIQAEAVFRGAQSVPAISAQLYTAEEGTAQLDELDAADAIIFGCPTYMGSMSAGMKSFIEVAAKKMVHARLEEQNSRRLHQFFVLFWRQAQYAGRARHQRHATRNDFCGSWDAAVGQ